MTIIAKLKGDKDFREIDFNGHGQNDPEKVKEVFFSIHPDGEFKEIKTPGLNGATGHTFVPDNGNEGLPAPVATAPAHDGTPVDGRPGELDPSLDTIRGDSGR